MYLWITLKAKGDWAQIDLQGSGRCSVLKRLWYSLVELPEIPSVVWIQGSSRRWKTFRWLKKLRCVLVELPKIPSVVGSKNLQKAEGIPMVEDVRCKLVELHGVVGSKGNSSMVVDVKLAASLI